MPDEPSPAPPPASPPAPPQLGPAAALRHAVELDDLELGRQVLELLGGGSAAGDTVGGSAGAGHCNACHSITRPTLSLWRHRTRAFEEACLGRTTLDDQEQVDGTYRCLLEHAEAAKGLSEFDPDLAKKTLSPRAVGIYAAASHLPWFSFLLENASQLQGRGTDARQRFVEQVGMPRGGVERLTQAEFDLLAEWFARDLPGMLELVPEDAGEPCVPGLAPELAAELDELAATGWRAKNLETPVLMFGCGPGESGSACLRALPSAAETPFGAKWTDVVPGSTIRVLYDNSDNPLTSFWTRSSADGRYVASGLSGVDGSSPDAGVAGPAGLSGQFVDLAGRRRILANFSYDPTFFPDNSGFLVQGAYAFDQSGKVDASSGTLVCNQGVLDGRSATITNDTQGCAGLGEEIGLYQQLSASLDGSDHWAVHGLFQSDEPGLGPQLGNPEAPFAGDSELSFTPIIDSGRGSSVGQTVRLDTPFQGDPAPSPSGRLLVTRSKGAEVFTDDPKLGPTIRAAQSGYTLYRVNTTRQGRQWSVALERAGQICMQGGKATFSLDERWLVTYRYVSAADAAELGFENAQNPGFAGYARLGGSNLYLIDLRSGQATRITNMSPGQYALFPHFRSDGWIYFVVRSSEGKELFVASDAALRLEESMPAAGARGGR